MTKLRALIVDDEPPARRKLRGFLSREADFEVVGEAGSGPEAVAAVKELQPDVVFLDIQMPGMDGFEVLQALQCLGGDMPCLVFATAYDQYALKAFEVCALDYLLKPFDRERLQSTLKRVRAHLEEEPTDLRQRMEELLRRLEERRRYPSRFLVKSRGRTIFLKVEEIDWIEAAANYAELHSGSRSYLLRETMNELEEKLDPRQFVRVHRSHIVNLDRIREIQPWSRNDFVIVLENGTQVRMSRRYRKNLEGSAGEPHAKPSSR